MIGRNTFRNAAYVALVAVILGLMDVYSSFMRKDVVADFFNLSQLFLYGLLFAGGLVAARSMAERGVFNALLNGAVGGLVVGAALTVLLQVVSALDFSEVRFVFQNMARLDGSVLMQGQSDLTLASVLLVLAGAVVGGLAGLLTQTPPRLRTMLVGAVGGVIIIGVLQGQINRIVTLGDALAVTVAFGLAYVLAKALGYRSALEQALIGAGAGLAVAIVFGLLVNGTGMERGALLRGTQQLAPTLLMMPLSGDWLTLGMYAGVLMLIGACGSALTSMSRSYHNAGWYFIAVVLSLGVLASQRSLNVPFAAIIAVIMGAVFFFTPSWGAQSEHVFRSIAAPARKVNRGVFFVTVLLILLVVPPFAGASLTNTLNLVMIYIIMGVGMNVMIGYAGLLDLGYVASFAIGAYTAGILTAPSILTCPGVVDQSAAFTALRGYESLEIGRAELCPYLMTFWQAWPIAIVVSGITGMMLGVPVLRLRGDYLAIVTLGFGEILQRILISSTFKPLFGGPQGVAQIPVPILNFPLPGGGLFVELDQSVEIYYLFLLVVGVGALIVVRLAASRLGRAWRAIRDDEDVAEAMGINTTVAKLLAFGVSSAFSGMGGALFGASLQGIFPNSFTLLVSINVLSLVILGGMGAIPGVFIGAFVLVGMPEILRELRDYRLLAFGVLLVVTMLLRPDGLLPPQPPKLSEHSTAARRAESLAGD